MLIYAHYYAPDVASTGQILQDMAEGMGREFDVTVICTVPSYTGTVAEGYREKRVYREEINGVRVLRVPVPPFSKASKKSRIVNLIAYFLRARRATRLAGPQDYVFTISQPPIMGGMLGVYGKGKLRAPAGGRPTLIYCIQDFNPEQTMAVGYIGNPAILGAMARLDNRSCRRSDLVVTVGRDLVETLKRRFAGKNVPKHVMINNWIDEKAIYPLPPEHPEVQAFRRQYGLEGRFVVMYSGNIGLYYDLEGLIRVIEQFRGATTPDGREVAFAFVGAGSVLDKLVAYKAAHGLDNVAFIPYQDKDRLIYSLNAADVHWCVNARGIKGVSCPSKFYGICGVQKPVLAVLERDSEVQMLIDEIGCGRCSEPGDYAGIQRDIAWFIDNAGSQTLADMGRRGHAYLLANLTKDVSIQKYIDAIKGL
ncbi:MAG: glycosyltransferase family 4 protein [Clostridia bacterium]|nr:glycosyltransferase family 4 protein [Clostridia bacterium]